MTNKVLVKQEGELSWIQLNRPEKRNAIDEEVISELLVALEIVTNDESKVVVVTGSGSEAFCSGGDLSVFHRLRTEAQAKEMLEKMGRVLLDLFYLPKLTVAALNGTAVGGGAEIATACDFRLAASHAKLGFLQGGLGITTGWGGASFLHERIGTPLSQEMLMSGQMYKSEDAKAKGFLQEIIADDKTFKAGIVEWLKPYTNKDLEVLKAYKRRSLDRIPRNCMERRVANEIAECAVLWEREEHHQAVDRFLQK
ncbi:enoyl-CoA hydratase/isomerase family protein [Halalkalibacterium ligniniphilum]|uniref:enoyl-CoA hydratase/isomerase family protein n=1 Tax=Halalkalibacterium ligniniphilum TaxID=1134413 RepID=UPI00036011EB|nr:enoyl-CoA hydratase/isomerase family protein [Halalkalibacterium ligniniphilum]